MGGGGVHSSRVENRSVINQPQSPTVSTGCVLQSGQSSGKQGEESTRDILHQEEALVKNLTPANSNDGKQTHI